MEKWKPKLFISDWDGTLFDSCALWDGCLKATFKHFGLEPPPAQIIRDGTTSKYMEFFHAHGIPENITHYDLRAQVWDPYITEHWNKARPYPWARSLFLKLRYHQITTKIVSASSFDYIIRGLYEWDFARFVHFIYPDAFDRKEAIKSLFSVTGVLPEDTVYMDDIASGIYAGKEAGVRTIGITHGMNSPELVRSAKPDILLHSLDEVIDRLNEGDFS